MYLIKPVLKMDIIHHVSFMAKTKRENRNRRKRIYEKNKNEWGKMSMCHIKN